MFQLNRSSCAVFSETTRLSPLIWLTICPCHLQSSRASWELRWNSIRWAWRLHCACHVFDIGSAFRKHTSPLYRNQLNVNVFKPPGLPENLVFEHSEIECPGQEPPLGVRSLTDIIEAKRGVVIGGCVQQVIWNWIILPQQWQHLVCLSTDTLVFTKIRWAERR